MDETRHLHIEVSDFLYKATLYEVPLLAIVSEIKNQFFGNVADMDEILCKLSEKVELSNQHRLRFSEFGTRRRFFCPCTGNGYQKIKRNGAVLHRHFQLLFCNEVRHENDGYSPA